MATNIQLLKDSLQNEGLRYTSQRQIVWDEIVKLMIIWMQKKYILKSKRAGKKSQEQRFTVRLMY